MAPKLKEPRGRPVSRAEESPGETETPRIADTPRLTIKKPERKVREKGKRAVGGCGKLSLRLSGEMQWRLNGLSMVEGETKEAFALRLIEQGCSKYGKDKDLKDAYARLMRKEGEAA